MEHKKGGFTMPGEAGFEALTLELAEKWGADVIRDSDGTELSPDIINAGYGIYSTICIIRDHNEWARLHPECLQQTFLSTSQATAVGEELEIDPLAEFFREQFSVNDSEAAMRFWQVWDRTENTPLPVEKWSWDAEKGVVTIKTVPFHSYTVSFLAYRKWEEISMYNHVTNHWDKEHLMPVDPRRPEARQYLKDWLKSWCETHPNTDVVRFTSLFYNFAWIWGADERNRSLFSDWGSYDFTVSDTALCDFEREYGYALTAEDFVNRGNYQVTHMPPTEHKRDYMDFTHRYVAELGRELVAIVHEYGKKAYVFYDDSWVGLEPYGPRFESIGFDGMIKCVFSGYEARMCAGVPAKVHELRLHPYLFPVGLGGAPTFSPGGDPTRDARDYWLHVRRALLRDKIDRIGLGGYVHLVQDYPDFVDYIAEIADEARTLRALHENGEVYTLPITVAVMTSWGALRPWTLSGHFHETYMHTLIHINEALAGLPVRTKFISFRDVIGDDKALDGVDVVINAGRAGSAWSGGEVWEDAGLVTALTKWVYEGGVLLGVGEPSAAPGGASFFRMANVLGVDEDTGAKVCHGKWPVNESPVDGLFPDGASVGAHEGVFLTGPETRVLKSENGLPALTEHKFGKGAGIYMGDFAWSVPNTRLLLNLLLYAAGRPLDTETIPSNPLTEAAYYPVGRRLVLLNNSGEAQETSVTAGGATVTETLEPFAALIRDIG